MHPSGIPPFPLPPGVILLAWRGSVAHNMRVETDDGDLDLVGLVIAPIEHYFGLQPWGSRGTMEVREGRYDCVFYEIRKAFTLLLQGNPNIMSLLWLRPEHYLLRTSAADRLLASRGLFAGRHVADSFAAYARAQLQKMETRDPAELREYMGIDAELAARGMHPNRDRNRAAPAPAERPYRDWAPEKLLRRWRGYQKKGENLGYLGEKRKGLVLEHGYDAKNAEHCIRLLRMCRECLLTGEMTVFRPDAAELMEIRNGAWPLERVKRHAAELFEAAVAARGRSPLPEGPDRAGAERLLVEILCARFGARSPSGQLAT